jgi:hypothetical protein
MSTAELEKVTKAWPPISHAVRVPRNDGNYQELVQLLDRVTDEVGEDEIIRRLRQWMCSECSSRNTKMSTSRS